MTRKRIAVVGAGIGGITAARTLVRKGHEVVVFEKEDRLGGKCFTRTFDGQPYEMGACSVSPEFKTVLRFARDYGARLRRRHPFWVLQPDGTRTTFREEYWKVRDTPKILLQMGRYLFHAANFALRYDRPSGFVDIPEAYQADFREFCRAHGMEDVAPWMDLPVTSFGYGDLSTIKAWYVLDYVNVVNFLGLAFLLVLAGKSPVNQLEHGYGDLVARIAEGLDVRLSTPVRRIDRGPDGVTITAGRKGSSPERFDAVVLAVPLQDVADCMNLCSEEEKIAADIHTNLYAVVACELEGMPHDNHLLRFNACQENFGHVALIERGLHGAAGDLCVCYVPIMDRVQTRSDTLATLREDLAAMGIRVRHPQPEAYEEWSYFSHFEHGRTYEILDHLQGCNSTYYVGGMAKFELAERVAREAEAIVDSRFEGDLPRERFTTLKNFAYFYLRSIGPYD